MSHATLNLSLAKDAGWHEWRAGGIGASECAAVLGISPYQTAWELYHRKLGLLPPVEESDAMHLGNLMEPVLASLYSRRTGSLVVNQQVRVECPDHPFIRATLDGQAEDGRLVEFKHVGSRMAGEWGDEGTDEAPAHYLCQVHHQMLAAGANAADLAVLIGGQDFRVYTVHRDAEMDSILVPRLAEFWARVERHDAPEVTEPDYRVVAKLRPTIEATTFLDSRCLDLADEFGSLGLDLSRLKNAREAVKAKLILAMDSHEAAELPDGRLVTRKLIERDGYPVEPTTYFDFRISKPKKG